jgi:hypothetical protein
MISPKGMESLEKSDRRKDLALVIVTVGAIVMTVYASVVLWMVRAFPGLAFWMGLSAMLIVMLVLTGILGLLVKRNFVISRGQIEISDHEEVEESSRTVTTVEHDSTSKSS